LGGTAKITALQFYPQSDDYLVGRADGQVGEGAGGKMFHTAQAANGPVISVAVMGENNEHFAALDGALNLSYFGFDEHGGGKTNEIKALGQSALTSETVNLTTMSKDGSVVLASGSGLEFYRYDFGGLGEDKQILPPSSRKVGSTSLEPQAITAVVISDDSKYLAVGLSDGSVSYRRHPVLLKTFQKFMDKEQAAEQKEHWESASILCMQANGIFPQPWLTERAQDMRAKAMEQQQDQQQKLMQMQRRGQ
jgi:hypothetical protein